MSSKYEVNYIEATMDGVHWYPHSLPGPYQVYRQVTEMDPRFKNLLHFLYKLKIKHDTGMSIKVIL